MAAVQTVEVVDAHGASALGDCSAEWCGDVLRMVCGAFPVALGQLGLGLIFSKCRLSSSCSRSGASDYGKPDAARNLRYTIYLSKVGNNARLAKFHV